ncbi:LptF/LptG family permease [Aquimarina agarilytica]|uniref:LptF/LptG family permease n=1 Tax=Aquimarina agarilytica TaxID=1087449 RepID=UPI00373FCB9E
MFNRFLQTFFVVFFIVMFIMILQMIWLYIAELAGKDLEFSVIVKFIVYASPTLIPLTLPLSILIASIMVFGEFSEHYEFAAMKSTGISLQRAIRFLTIFMVVLSIGTFFFANDIIPASQRKFIGLRRNIVRLKPAVAITANQFNEVGDINIKVASKYGDNDQYLDDVIIHKQKPNLKGNYTVIKSKSGELVSGADSDVLSLILRDGYYYDEVIPKKIKERKKHPFVKSEFKEYAINLDLSSFNDVDMSKNDYIKNRKMLNVNLLKKDIDSFSVKLNTDREDFARRTVQRLKINSIADGMNFPCEVDEYPASIEHILQYEKQRTVLNEANRLINSNLNRIKQEAKDVQRTKENLNKFEIALHEKYALAFACIVLFFIGAPLGAIIRKGGLGLPLLYAIGIFLSYHFIGIFAKNSAENGAISPFLSSWLSTLIILPLGILLTYRATTEKNLITLDLSKFKLIKFLDHFFKKLFKKKKK